MKQISTGAGLLGLGVCMVATAFITAHRSGGEAFAQGAAGDRRIVAQGVYTSPWQYHCIYRVWSDNVTEVKFAGSDAYVQDSDGYAIGMRVDTSGFGSGGAWQVIDAGTPTFMRTDIDISGNVDAGDIAQVILDFNTTTDPTTPPPIDCNINAPR